MGYSTIAIDRNSHAPGLTYADAYISTSTLDTEVIIAALKELENQYEFRGVVARTTGQALYTAAAISEVFRLPGLTRELVRISIEKSALREFCEANGLPVPRGHVMERTGRLPAGWSFPVVIKPDLPYVGKQAVSLVNDPADVIDKVDQACSMSMNRRAEIEEFIPGIDVGCFFYANKGRVQIIAFCDELVAFDKDGQALGMGNSVLSVIMGTPAEAKIRTFIDEFSSLFNEVNAILIAIFRISPEGDIYLIEMHADLGGDKVAEVLFANAAHHFDFFSLAVQVAVGTVSSLLPVEFSPTTLYFPFSGKADVAIPGLELHPDYALAKTGSLRSNLMLLPEVNRICNRYMSLQPSHLTWLEHKDPYSEKKG
jgi:hypothetical protein